MKTRIRIASHIFAALLPCAISSLNAQTLQWWDDYPMIVETPSVAQVQASNGTCGFSTGDPSWGIYIQKAIGDWVTPVQMHDAGYKYITYYETFGTATCFLTELGAPTTEGDNSIYRTYWSWNYIDTNGGAFRWAGPQNYFDAEDFCGPYTRRHPVYGAGGRAMTYPDGTPATGYFDNDNTDPRKSRVLDAACSKDILGAVENWLEYRDEAAGNPLREGGLLPVTVNGQSHLAGHADFAKDAACPMWIDQQRSSILYSVAQGQIDGIWSDNFGPWDNFGYPPVKVAFGDWSVARFRDYLSTHFTTAELTAMGVSNVTTFDVRTALRSKLTSLGGTSTNLDDAKWNDSSWLNDSLWRAYKIYKRQVGTEALTNYYNVTKAAAAQMGVSDFAVFGNDIPVFSLGYCRGTLDAVSTEISPGWHMGTSARGFMMPPVGRFGPAYKLGREHAKSRLLNVWMYLESAYKENPGAVNAIYYEMLANHTLPMLHPGNPGTTQDATINGGFTNFVKNSRATFGGRDTLTDVGIYYSTSSVLAYMTPAGFLDLSNQPATAAYNGWGTALGNLHYQYRPIPEWKLTAAALAKLRVLVIPNAEVLDSADVANIIDPWVRAGGLLIVTGNSGARKGESGNFDPYSNFSLSGLTGVTTLSGAPATRLSTVGSGKVYYINANIGLSYFNASTATDRNNLIAGFSTAMDQVLGTNKTILATVTSIPDTVGLNVYEDPAARRLFIDVNNYDVNLATDAVTATPASTFTVAAPVWLASASIANIRVKVLSPTTPAPTVTVTKSGTDRIQVVLGAVTNYASIVVSEETSLTWNGGGGSPSDSSGTWNATNTNWWGMTAVPWSDLYDGVFGVGTGSNTPYTISLESGFTPTVGNLIFANHAYTLSNGSINLGAASEIQVDVGRTATINSTLAGASVGLTKTGAGNLTLTGTNTYTGATTITAGLLSVTGAGQLYSNLGWNNTVVTIQSGGILEADRWDGLGALGQLNYAQSNIVINGGTIRYIGTSNGTSQGAGFTIGTNGATLQSEAPSGQSWNINFDDRQLYYAIASNSVGTLTLGGSGNGLISKVIPGNGGVSKIGNGTWALTGANSYTGGTTVSGGTLSVTGAGQLYSNLGWNNQVVLIQSGGVFEVDRWDGLGALGQLGYAKENIVVDGGTIRYIGNSNATTGGGTGLTIGANGATLQSNAPSGQLWNINLDDRNSGSFGIASNSEGTLTLAGTGNGIIRKVIPGSGGVFKTGNGTWTLTGANSYTGTTTVISGTLSLGDGTTHSSLADTASVVIGTDPSAFLNLNFSGTDTVGSLIINGVVKAPGSIVSSSDPSGRITGNGTLTVAPNSAPIASAQSVSTAEDTAKPITLTATDANGNPLTYTIVAQPAHGSLSGTAPNVTYTPVLNYNGADSFAFKVNDGIIDSVIATVSVTVTAVNDVPVFTTNPIVAAGATESVAYTGQSLASKATDADAGDAITYSKVSGPSWLAVATNGALTGTPPSGSAGLNSFVVRATDSAAANVTATVSITVTPGGPAITVNAQISAKSSGTATINLTTGFQASVNASNKLVVMTSGRGSGGSIYGKSLTSIKYGTTLLLPAINLRSNDVSPTAGGEEVAAIYYLDNPGATPATTITITYAGAMDSSSGYTALALSGTAPGVSVANGGVTAGSVMSGSTTLTTTVANSLVLAVGAADRASTTPQSPLSLIYSNSVSPGGTYGSGSQLVPTPATLTPTFTYSAAKTTPVTVAAAFAPAGLPLPWVTTNIGTGMLTGSLSYNAGTFTQAGSGTLGTTSDKLNFAYQTLTGDGEIIARISALQDTGTSSRVGVMIRDTLANNSKQVFMGMSGSNGYRWVRRTTTAGSNTTTTSSTGAVPNTWVRLVRSGTTITAYKSTNGSSWTTVGTTTGTTFASTCYIGLAINSGSDTTLNTSQFTNVTVTP